MLVFLVNLQDAVSERKCGARLKGFEVVPFVRVEEAFCARDCPDRLSGRRRLD